MRIGKLFRLSRFVFKVFIITLFKVRIKGKEKAPAPPFIVAANHSSNLDPPLVGMIFMEYQVDFMAKVELFNPPIMAAWSKLVGCIPVDRGKSSVKAMREAIRRLKNGRIVGIFPEGTRSTEGDIREAKRGTGFLIAKAEVPVVPCYIKGSGKAFPKGGGVRRGTQIEVHVGEPIRPDEVLAALGGEKADYEAVSAMLMDRISAIKNMAEKEERGGEKG